MSAPASTGRADAPLDARARAAGVRLIALDVDGTLTDGAILIAADRELFKAFDVRDGFGLTLLRRAGLALAIITGRRSGIVEQRAHELAIPRVLQGVGDKRAALLGLCAELRIAPAQAAFVGDDWPDLPAMAIAGLAATVADAPAELRARAHWVSSRPGGRGAVREFAEWLLDAQGCLDALRAEYLR